MPDTLARKQSQFQTLYRVFLLRVVDLELLSSDADPSRLITQFATIFATISFFATLPALLAMINMVAGSHLSRTDAWTAEHFFIESSITLAGLVTVLNWDSAYPDRRDVLVLAPLPVHPGTLFLAKITALFAATGLAVLMLNVFVGLAWPVLFTPVHGGYFAVFRSWPAYAATIFLASAFCVCFILAIQGFAANLLPRQLFLRLSALLQAAITSTLLLVYFLGPSLEDPFALTSPANQHALALLPSYWFLGLFNQLNGTPHPALAPLATRAWIALALAAAAAAFALLLSWLKMTRRVIEQPDILPAARTLPCIPGFGNQVTTAITYFSLRTLFRSRQHRMVLSFYLGLGLSIVIGYYRLFLGSRASRTSGPSPEFLFVSILVLVLTLLAMRVVASIPIALRANWIIRTTQVQPAGRYLSAVRITWLLLGVVPVLLVTAVGIAVLHAPPAHLLALLLLGFLLVEIFLYTFPKVPFTCSYMPGKAKIHFAFWAALVLFLKLIYEAAATEDRILHRTPATACLVLALASFAAALHQLNNSRTRSTYNNDLIFEEENPADLLSLKISP